MSPGLYHMCSQMPAIGNGTTSGKQEEFQNTKMQKCCSTMPGKHDKSAWRHT